MIKKKKESEVQEEVKLVVEEVSPKFSYEEWWTTRKEALKVKDFFFEILRADFRGQGLSEQLSLEEWDAGARKFGLKF